METNEVRSCSSKILGVGENYFTSSGEQFLSSMIEQPAALVIRRILDYFQDEKCVHVQIMPEDQRIIKKFEFLLMCRSKSFLNSMNKTSVFAQFLPERDVHDFAVAFATDNFETAEIPFMNYYLGLMHITTGDSTFVTLRNGFYSAILHNDDNAIVMPISPKNAIILTEKEPYYLEIDDSYVNFLNLQAYKMEKQFNNAFLASAYKEELIKLKESVERIKLNPMK